MVRGSPERLGYGGELASSTDSTRRTNGRPWMPPYLQTKIGNQLKRRCGCSAPGDGSGVAWRGRQGGPGLLVGTVTEQGRGWLCVCVLFLLSLLADDGLLLFIVHCASMTSRPARGALLTVATLIFFLCYNASRPIYLIGMCMASDIS